MNEATFYPATTSEHGRAIESVIDPRYKLIRCGTCGRTSDARVVASYEHASRGTVLFCQCPIANCPTIVIQGATGVQQIPGACDFVAGANWPEDIATFHYEMCRTFSAGAYTAATMMARKLVMYCACREGSPDNAAFPAHVDHLTIRVLRYDRSKPWIDRIRTIGNDSNRLIQFVERDAAHDALEIVTYLLTAVYTPRLPS